MYNQFLQRRPLPQPQHRPRNNNNTWFWCFNCDCGKLWTLFLVCVILVMLAMMLLLEGGALFGPGNNKLKAKSRRGGGGISGGGGGGGADALHTSNSDDSDTSGGGGPVVRGSSIDGRRGHGGSTYGEHLHQQQQQQQQENQNRHPLQARSSEDASGSSDSDGVSGSSSSSSSSSYPPLANLTFMRALWLPQPPMLYGTAWKKEETTKLVMQAFSAGFRAFDTACQPRHYREDLVGRGIQLALKAAAEEAVKRQKNGAAAAAGSGGVDKKALSKGDDDNDEPDAVLVVVDLHNNSAATAGAVGGDGDNSELQPTPPSTPTALKKKKKKPAGQPHSNTIISRHDVYIQTKFTPLSGQDPDTVPYDKNATISTQVRQSLDVSLRNLQTSYLDAWLLHSPLPGGHTSTMEAYHAMEKHGINSGKVKFLGLSNFYDLKLLQKVYHDAIIKPKILQNRFVAATHYDVDLREFCWVHKMQYQSFWTLTGNRDMLAHNPILHKAFNAAKEEEQHELEGGGGVGGTGSGSNSISSVGGPIIGQAVTVEQFWLRFLMDLGIAPLIGSKSVRHLKEDLECVLATSSSTTTTNSGIHSSDAALLLHKLPDRVIAKLKPLIGE